jgi:ferritin
MERRSSIDKYLKKFTETLGFGVGDLVSYAPTGYKVMGIVTNIDPKIRKVFVDWAGCGNIHQHDADELQITQIQDKRVLNRMASQKLNRIAANIVGDVPTTEFLTQETAELLNKQFACELANSAFYRVMASWFENNGYPGFRAYFNRQGDGEAEHAMKVYTFLVDAGIQVQFPTMSDQPIANEFKGLIKQFLTRETETTKNWQIISESAKLGYNVAALELCQWFMKEQMEEESSASILYQKVMALPMTQGIETLDALLRSEDPTFPIVKTANIQRRI